MQGFREFKELKYNKKEVIKYLETLVGVELYKKQKRELSNFIRERHNGKIKNMKMFYQDLLHPFTIESWFSSNDIDFEIRSISPQGNNLKTLSGNLNYWVISKYDRSPYLPTEKEFYNYLGENEENIKKYETLCEEHKKIIMKRDTENARQ